MRLLTVAGIILLLSSTAEARKFSFGSQAFGAYFNVTAGKPPLGHDAVSRETALDLGYDGDVSNVLSGEFGIAYSSPRGNLRFGIEVFKPSTLNGTASNGATPLYDYESESSVLTPKVSIDLNLQNGRTSRSYAEAFVGMAFLQLKNSYTLTTSGNSQLPGVNDHDVMMGGQAALTGVALGYETHFTDNSTVYLEFGYRMLKFDNIKYKKDGTSFNGAYNDGETVRTSQGGNRVQDYTGAFASVGFRFYL